LIDSGAEDYMVETAMLKVFASDQLWRIVNDTLQIWGGKGFFTDQPFERMMRDARLNLIGEGANDVLRCFIAAVGLRHLGKDMERVLKAPWTAYKLLRTKPKIPVKHDHLTYYARGLSRQIAQFAWACELSLIKYREKIIDQQFIQARLGDIATELFMASCVYSRLSSLIVNGVVPESAKQRDLQTGMLYMRYAKHRNNRRFAELKANFDTMVTDLAKVWMQHDYSQNWVLKPENETPEQ
jgi:alkylation response protein AidB-like acyl-CoA dehydrogenase